MSKNVLSFLVVTMVAFTLLFSGTLMAASHQFQEAPVLQELVDEGELEEVSDRLPAEPLVVEPEEEVGQYGGTWRHGLVDMGANMVYRTIGYEHLMRWSVDYEEVVPNIAKSVDVNDEATEYTFHLREGMKWSDGEPFTADDIMFWYEAVHLYEDLPSISIGSLEVEKVDDYTVKFSFEEPRGLFLEQDVAAPNGWVYTAYPRHYLEQFHADYNDNIDQLAEEEGYAEWTEMFENISGLSLGAPGAEYFQNTELPRLTAWIPENPIDTESRFEVVRNPYFWKVDPDNKQLPYIDEIYFDRFDSPETLILRALNGEIDFRDNTDGMFGDIEERSVFYDQREAGDFRFVELIPTASTDLTLYLNLTHSDPVMKEIFQNKNFRIGISHAINRDEINQTMYFGQAEPHQVAPREESPFYNEEFAKQFTEHDIELANQYLDEAGFEERDSQGYRLGPDGERISFSVMVTADRLTEVDGMGFVQSHLEEVGIEMNLDSVESSYFWSRFGAGEFEAIVWSGPGGAGWDVILDTYGWLPDNWWAPEWTDYFDDPEDETAEQPWPETKRQIELYRELQRIADYDQQVEKMEEILNIAREQFYVIGIVLRPNNFGIAKNNFRNVPDEIFHSWMYPNPGPTNPEQYYFAD